MAVSGAGMSTKDDFNDRVDSDLLDEGEEIELRYKIMDAAIMGGVIVFFIAAAIACLFLTDYILGEDADKSLGFFTAFGFFLIFLCMLQRWFWLLLFILASLSCYIAAIANIIHFNIFSAVAFFLLASVCMVISHFVMQDM